MWALFILSSIGNLYSIGYNGDGAAARGMKNVQDVELGECEIKLKGKKCQKPKFIKVLGYKNKVAALTDNGRIFLCGEDVLPFMGEKSRRNVYAFKELELPYYFTDMDFDTTNGITGFISDDNCGIIIERGGNVRKIFEKDIQLKNYSRDDSEDEEDDEKDIGNQAEEKKLIKYLRHADCDILIYDNYSIDIKYRGVYYSYKLSSPICYPNNGCIYELACDRLNELRDFSRDGPNLLYSICPDTWLTSAVSIVFLLVYIIVLIVSGIGLYLRRNSPHIKARNITYLFMTILSNSGFIILTCLRFIIGRRIYPCSIYILSFFIVPPGILLPSVFRLWRLFFMHKLNLQKTKMDSNRKETNHENLKSSMKVVPNNSNMNSPKSQLSNVESIFNNNQDSNDATSSDGDNYSYWIENELEMKKNVKIQKIFNILLSQKFVIATYLTSFIIHILLFIFFGAVEEGIYNQDPIKSNNQRIFMGDGGFFVSSRGCVITNAITIIVAIESLFYIVVEIVFLVLCFIIPRDTWFIKRETLLLTLLQFFSIILFAICGFLVQVTKLTDFFVPFGFTLMVYSFTEVVICVLLPILYSIVLLNRTKKERVEESELEHFLKSKKTFNILLDFARRSYCPESVLCYQDIERFKLTSKKNRKQAALHITKTYLKPNSPLELNFPKLSQMFEQISKAIETTPLLETNFFDNIQWHCIEDMTDVFERLKSQNKEVRNILKQWKVASLNDLTTSQQVTLHNITSNDTNNNNNQEELKDIKLESNHNSPIQQVDEQQLTNSIEKSNENIEESKEKTQIDNLDYL
ncbi:predicted protein [Naegleria gruberi]|uniref:Predicted protein n=1 Tax=Naegleria gruberi TaxID=5762 RepID=D2VD84_NAEGR|nr:uncharacterized protein NAEGRDRAFT_66943 [Naegleria gruberi]EFC45286.1 predicted protein [Naegleria gruberi]|eukprot:XP_002678030.1 predicted protein [Naegleria gruberi strain NEG-M]